MDFCTLTQQLTRFQVTASRGLSATHELFVVLKGYIGMVC